jgi:hypothetical protein
LYGKWKLIFSLLAIFVQLHFLNIFYFYFSFANTIICIKEKFIIVNYLQQENLNQVIGMCVGKNKIKGGKRSEKKQLNIEFLY